MAKRPLLREAAKELAMGADLYIKAVFEASRTEWEAEFYAAAKLRDSLPEGSLAA